jgi:hypothetical protein
MSNTTTMQRYRVDNSFGDASKAAFSFANLEKRHKSQSESHTLRLEDIGGKVSPTWVVMSVVGLCAAIGFGIYGAFNAQGAIAGLVDPMGEGVIQPEILFIIGASISIVGMIFGHFIYEGLSEGFETDPYTGVKSASSKIWLSVVGFVGAIVYVGYQFYLVKSAGESAGVDENSSLAYMPYVVAGIAILELLIGAFILHKAFGYIMLFVTVILLSITVRQMNAAARNTNDSYRQYIRFVDVYNGENSTNQMEREGSPNIRKAIAHYSGISLNDEQTQQGQTQRSTEQPSANEPTLENNVQPSSGQRTQHNRNGATSQGNAEQAVEEFMNDTTDQDLTA